jgi:hypothetical protein
MGQSAAQVAGGARAAEARPALPWRKAAWWAWAAAYAAAGVVLFFCYLRLSGTRPVTSDGAANALQAWDMLHGNLLLRGWTVSDVSFYTTELPEYMGVELIRGLGPDVVHVARRRSPTRCWYCWRGCWPRGGRRAARGWSVS